jgi:hypothetical protein
MCSAFSVHAKTSYALQNYAAQLNEIVNTSQPVHLTVVLDGWLLYTMTGGELRAIEEMAEDGEPHTPESFTMRGRAVRFIEKGNELMGLVGKIGVANRTWRVSPEAFAWCLNPLNEPPERLASFLIVEEKAAIQEFYDHGA